MNANLKLPNWAIEVAEKLQQGLSRNESDEEKSQVNGSRKSEVGSRKDTPRFGREEVGRRKSEGK